MVEDERRPLDRSPYYVNKTEHLDRVLGRPQLAGIGISACVGGGIFITSGALISTTGSIGASISYAIAGGIVGCVLYTITEMVTCRPLTGALIDLPHKFLDPACGFTVAALYGLGKICAMATLTALAAKLTSQLKTDQKAHSTSVEALINLGFIALTTLSHCLGVKLYGRIERVIMWFKICLLMLCIVLGAALNLGAGSPREGAYNTNYTSNAFAPGWSPTGYRQTSAIPLTLGNVPESSFGISGSGGQVFALVTSITLAMFSCLGADLVAFTVGEAKNPWRDVPATMSVVYLIPLSIYPFVMFAGAANLNYADPNLSKNWGRGAPTKSPFVIAAEQSSLHALPKVLNALFILSAYTTANTDLYAASRSVFMLSQQYLPAKIARVLGRTNNGGTPLAAILLCSALGLLSLIGLADKGGSQPRITLAALYTSTSACINLCLCVTFLQFKAGLDRFEKRQVFSRNDPLYISHLYRSRWQPAPAWIGILGCAAVIFWSGIPPLIIIAMKGPLTTGGTLKSRTGLAFDVIGAYCGPCLFAVFYLSYKFIYPRSKTVDLRNLTIDDYVLEDLSKIERDGQDDPATMPATGYTESHGPEMQSGVVSPMGDLDNSFHREETYDSVGMSIEAQEDAEAQDAREKEREKIAQILRKRPKRFHRGMWRELWSFVVADAD